MTKIFGVILPLILLMILLAACATQVIPPATSSATNTDLPAASSPAVTGTPEATMPNLVEVSGVVKKIDGDLVLIATQDAGDFVLDFSGNSKWADGVSTKIEIGNTMTCRVKPEPTFTTPDRGEVYLVLSNKKG